MSSLITRFASWQAISPISQLTDGKININVGIAVVVALVIPLLLYAKGRRYSYTYKRIPGPAGWPILGLVTGLPSHFPWIEFKKWGDEYASDIVAFRSFGSMTVIVNTWDIAQELFVKRASVFSDRPRFPMMNEVGGWDWNFALMGYGPSWRAHRKLFRQEIEINGAALHEPHALRSVKRLLKHILETPRDYYAHIRHSAALAILSTAYGLDLKPSHDPFVELAESAMQGAAHMGNPGSYLVDYIPVLQHIVPAWLPGWLGQWKRDGARWAEQVTGLRNSPFDYARSQYAKDDGMDCVVSRVMDRLQNVEEEERESVLTLLQSVLGVVYAAGSDTTVSVVHSFLLAMVLYPELQRKGQEEVDRVIGNTELPNFESGHIDSTPYVNALVKECLRWQPVTPLAIAHATSEDCVYGEYFIPKGATVFGNAWAMLREEKFFGPKTDEFLPERFLTTKEVNGLNADGSQKHEVILDPLVPDPSMAFGLGRRICPGRHIAYKTVWLTVASLLQCFNITKGTDDNGKVVTPEVEYTSGLLSFPHHFPCNFEVRSGHLKKIIETVE